MAIADEKYVRLTTFTRSGDEKHTPVWIVDMGDGRVGFHTEAGSWKVRRITNNPAVRLVPCDMRGRVAQGSEPLSGTAEVFDSATPEFAGIRRLIDAKYGLSAKAIKVQSKISKLIKRSEPERCAIAIQLT